MNSHQCWLQSPINFSLCSMASYVKTAVLTIINTYSLLWYVWPRNKTTKHDSLVIPVSAIAENSKLFISYRMSNCICRAQWFRLGCTNRRPIGNTRLPYTSVKCFLKILNINFFRKDCTLYSPLLSHTWPTSLVYIICLILVDTRNCNNYK